MGPEHNFKVRAVHKVRFMNILCRCDNQPGVADRVPKGSFCSRLRQKFDCDVYRSATIAKSHGFSFRPCPCRTEALVKRSDPSPYGYERDCSCPEKFR